MCSKKNNKQKNKKKQNKKKPKAVFFFFFFLALFVSALICHALIRCHFGIAILKIKKSNGA
jgi:hypothetical protein